MGSATRLDVLPPTFRDAPSAMSEIEETPKGPIMTGIAGRLPDAEQQAIIAVAKAKSVDPLALAAIRIAENGAAGREFGVLSVQGQAWYESRVLKVGTFQAQAEVAAQSLKNAETRYRASGGDPYGGGQRYTFDFWQFFGARWAPIDVSNDPRGLNRYWTDNTAAAYNGSALA